METEVPVNLRRILILLVLVAALGTYLYVYEVPQAQKEGKKDKLLGFDKDAVTGITLVYHDREIELRKEDTGWRLVRPIEAPADEAAVKGLVSTLADAEAQKTLDELPQDLPSFGLDKPDPVVTLTLKDGAQPPPLAVGKTTTIGAKTYVRKGDEPRIYLSSSSLHYGLAKQVKDLRDKQLITFQDDDVSRVDVVRGGGETTTLVRKDKDAWTVDPGAHAADPTEVRSFLGSLRAARAVDFPDDAPAELGKYGLDKPRLAVTVATGKDAGGDQKTVVFGAELTENSQKQVYVKRTNAPTVYTLGDWSFRALDKGPNTFRDKTVLGFDPARVGRFTLERKDGGSVTAARDDTGQWRLEGIEGKPNGASIGRFLDDVRDLRGADIAAEPARRLDPYGLDVPDFRVSLVDAKGEPIGTVLAGKRDKHFLMREGGDTIFEARDYMYARLDKHPRDFVEAEGGVSTTTTPPPVHGFDPQGMDEDTGDDEAEDE